MGASVIAPIVASAIQAGGNATTSAISEANARDAFQHRYQDTVADMRAAGLNPALAYGQGGGNPQTSDISDIGTSLAQGYQSYSSAKQAQAQEHLTTSQANLLDAQAMDLIYRTKMDAASAGFGRDTAQFQASTAKETWEQAVLKTIRDSATNPGQIAGTNASNTMLGLQVPRQQIEAGAARGFQKLYTSAKAMWDDQMTKLASPDWRE